MHNPLSRNNIYLFILPMTDQSISVITVTFNAEKTLERTLKSVAEQDYPNIEHIVVGGNSTDGTIDIIRRYERSQLKWKSETDKGLYDAMNKGAAMASGDYLCFLNAGDMFHSKETLKQLFHSLPENETPDILYGETDIVDENGKFLFHRRLRAPEKLKWTSFKQGMMVCHQAFIVRRAIFEPYNLSYRYSADVDWCIRMMKKAKNIFNSHLILINYLNEGMTTANRNASLKERYRIMNNHYGRLSTFLHHVWFAVRAVVNPEK